MNIKQQERSFQSVLATPINEFLAAKRALGKRYVSEAKVLRLFDRYLVEQLIETVQDITPEMTESFLASRPRTTPQSYNQLLSALSRLFEWLTLHKWITRSPMHAKPRRTTAHKIPFIFNATQARRLLKMAEQLPSRPTAPDRGATYRMIFALLYALGLRVGEVSRLQIQDVDFQRDLLVIRARFKNRVFRVPIDELLPTATLPGISAHR